MQIRMQNITSHRAHTHNTDIGNMIEDTYKHINEKEIHTAMEISNRTLVPSLAHLIRHFELAPCTSYNMHMHPNKIQNLEDVGEIVGACEWDFNVNLFHLVIYSLY